MTDHDQFRSEMPIFTEPTVSFTVLHQGKNHVYHMSQSVVQEMQENGLDPQSFWEKWHRDRVWMDTRKMTEKEKKMLGGVYE